jgi:cytochrome c oxidase subunit II
VAVFTVPVIFELDEKPDGGIEVAVEGQQFWWAYHYDAAAGATERPFATANELHIPAGEPVYLTLTSKDVIHSFWAPRLNGKRDVVPGRVHHWTLEADEPGVYAGQCAEFCGTSHANMRLKVVAHDRAGYEEWLTDQQREGTTPEGTVTAQQATTTTSTATTGEGSAAEDEDDPEGDPATGFALFEQKGCAGCHQVDGVWEDVAADSPSAPNLTHLFDRDCFAGCIYDLDDRNEMEAWLRDPQRKAGSLMVIGELTEAEIDDLYAYLRTLD